MLFGIAFLIFSVAFMGRTISNARSDPWAGPQTKGQRGRARQGLQARGGQQRTLRQDLRHLREEALATDWLKHRDHDRAMTAKHGPGYTPTASPMPPKARTFGRRNNGAAVTPQVLSGLAQRVPAAATAGANGHKPGGGSPPGAAPSPPPAAPGANGRGWRPGPIRRSNGSTPAPPPRPAQASSTSQTSPSSGGNGTVAGNGHVEQLIEGYNGIYAEAVAGNIHAKLRGIKSATEGSTRGSQMAAMLSRSMSESNYGPEIAEPLAKASQHEQAAAMAYAEADAALGSLMQMSLAEKATSSRQTPHHTELTENGSH